MLKLLGDRSHHKFWGRCEVSHRSIVLKDGVNTLLIFSSGLPKATLTQDPCTQTVVYASTVIKKEHHIFASSFGDFTLLSDYNYNSFCSLWKKF